MPEAANPESGTRAPYAPSEEVRFGVVMYGGVSLAIYIGGVTQELLNLVRATAPGPDGRVRYSDAELGSSDAVYREVARRRNREGAAPDGAITTRFVVDLVSGSSAGGINGVFLGKALAIGGDLAGIRRVWLDEADLSLLVNDKMSSKGTDTPLDVPPVSLLNGNRMYGMLVKALDDMDAPPSDTAGAAPTPLLDELDLYVTATDLTGTVAPLKLKDGVAYETDHRTVWHLRFGPTPDGTGRDADFDAPANPLLAFAARTTSSFPFAFAPFSLGDAERILQGLPHHPNAIGADRKARFFRTFADVDPAQLSGRVFGDGGALDNMPFSSIVDALRARRSTAPVHRILLYVEPDPGNPTGVPAPPVHPDPVTSVIDLAVLLPRQQTIREDLENVRQRNETAGRALAIVASVDGAAQVPGALPDPPPNNDAWLDSIPPSLAEQAAFRLKLNMVIDEFAGIVTRAATELVSGSDHERGVAALLRAWIDLMESTTPHSIKTAKQVLLDLDIGYRLRRIDFVQRRADELYPLDGAAENLLAIAHAGTAPVCSDASTFRTALVDAKRALNGAYATLMRVRAVLEGRIDRDSTAGIRAAIDRAFPATLVVDELNRRGELGVAGPALNLPEVTAYDGPFDQDRPDHGDGPVEWMATVYNAVVAVTHEAFSRASNECEAALDASRVEAPEAKLALETLRFFYDRYESYDQALLPVWSTFDGELDVVDVMRVSPFDANALFDEEKLGEPGNPAKKLAGVRFGHFGGFLDRRWRRSDMMWGRLDGAERLIEALLEPGAERTELIRAAQLAIVCEELPERSGLADLIYRQLLDGGDGGDRDTAALSDREREQLVQDAIHSQLEPSALLDSLGERHDPPALDGHTTLRTAGRGLDVTGDLFRGMTANRQVRTVSGLVSVLGRAVTIVVGGAVPGSFGRLLARYWAFVLLLSAVLLLGVGFAIGGQGLKTAGWIGIGVALLVLVVVSAFPSVRARLTRRKRART